MSRFIVNFGSKEHEYIVNNVRYTVASRFTSPSLEKEMLSDRLSKFIGGDFANLTISTPESKIADEYVCSTAGKED
jgi:hypothetical protein